MKVMLGLSGGVDSSVAALRLKQAGHEVEALFMRNWEEDDDGPCRADLDRKDAVAVCAQLGLPFHGRNFAAQYRRDVFAHFLAEYRAGRTPNPDIACNREIKFKTFLQEARQLGADRIATGHYARIDHVDGSWRLLRGRDRNKDQSYFLHQLGQQALAATLFPIGDLEKPEVRRIAHEVQLPTRAKKDSTGICFIGERDFRDFLARYIPRQAGELRTPEGKPVGWHQGAPYYTLGQRGGLGIGGRAGTGGEPWYVVGKDVGANIVYVAQGGDTHWLQSRRLRASRLHWIDEQSHDGSLVCTARTRYRQPDQSCTVHVAGNRCEVLFDTPQRAVTPGQSVVFYDGEHCLGGGIIETTDAPFGGWNRHTEAATRSHRQTTNA